MGARLRRTVVLLDVDNTLYDWLGFFGPAMRGLCVRLSELSGVSVGQLYDDFRTVFAGHGTVEYTFAVQELQCLRARHPASSRVELVHRYRDAIDMYASRRRSYLHAYPRVREGLQLLREAGVRTYAVSDARRFHVSMRLKQLGILPLLSGVCAVADHAEADLDELTRIRRHDEREYDIRSAHDLILPAGLRKPAKDVVEWVMAQVGVNRDDVIYVGDSLIKDVPMAQAAGVTDCWAAYGVMYAGSDVQTLLRITNWTAHEVQRFLLSKPADLGLKPSFVATSFDDVVALATQTRAERQRAYEDKQLALPTPGTFDLAPEHVMRTEHER